jgi:hypothetical protein
MEDKHMCTYKPVEKQFLSDPYKDQQELPDGVFGITPTIVSTQVADVPMLEIGTETPPERIVDVLNRYLLMQKLKALILERKPGIKTRQAIHPPAWNISQASVSRKTRYFQDKPGLSVQRRILPGRETRNMPLKTSLEAHGTSMQEEQETNRLLQASSGIIERLFEKVGPEVGNSHKGSHISDILDFQQALNCRETGFAPTKKLAIKEVSSKDKLGLSDKYEDIEDDTMAVVEGQVNLNLNDLLKVFQSAAKQIGDPQSKDPELQDNHHEEPEQLPKLARTFFKHGGGLRSSSGSKKVSARKPKFYQKALEKFRVGDPYDRLLRHFEQQAAKAIDYVVRRRHARETSEKDTPQGKGPKVAARRHGEQLWDVQLHPKLRLLLETLKAQQNMQSVKRKPTIFKHVTTGKAAHLFQTDESAEHVRRSQAQH